MTNVPGPPLLQAWVFLVPTQRCMTRQKRRRGILGYSKSVFSPTRINLLCVIRAYVFLPVVLIMNLFQMVPLVDGQIAIIRGSDRCTELISVGKPVLASAVSADLLIGRPGLELVLGTDDGTLICLANTPATAVSR